MFNNYVPKQINKSMLCGLVLIWNHYVQIFQGNSVPKNKSYSSLKFDRQEKKQALKNYGTHLTGRLLCKELSRMSLSLRSFS